MINISPRLYVGTTAYVMILGCVLSSELKYGVFSQDNRAKKSLMTLEPPP